MRSPERGGQLLGGVGAEVGSVGHEAVRSGARPWVRTSGSGAPAAAQAFALPMSRP